MVTAITSGHAHASARSCTSLSPFLSGFDFAQFDVEFGFRGVDQESVEAAFVFNGAEAGGRDFDRDPALEGFAIKARFLDVGQEAAAGSVFRVGDDLRPGKNVASLLRPGPPEAQTA